MFGLLAFCSAVYLGVSFAKEALEKPNPPGVRFDQEAYFRDSCDPNVSFKELQRRVKNNYYATTKPRPPYPWELPEGTVVDVEAYESDKAMYGVEYAEQKREWGMYKVKRPYL